MKISFKAPRELGGVHYSPGVREVPDSLMNHWYLLAMIKSGTASIVEGAKIKETDQEPVEAPKEKRKYARRVKSDEATTA